MVYSDRCDISVLNGQTLESVDLVTTYDDKPDEVHFALTTGQRYKMHHYHDCCETVVVEDVCGDLADLIGSPILLAEVVSTADRPKDLPEPEYEPESQTWTFYKLATINGSVTIRWFGESNGYYSEAVDFELITED